MNRGVMGRGRWGDNRLVGLLAGILSVLVLGLASPAWAQPTSSGDEAAASANAAPVVIDGYELFTLRGITSYPADERATIIRRNIIAAARDTAVTPADVHTVEAAGRTRILAGETPLLSVIDLDGDFEGVDRRILADTFSGKIAEAIFRYRTDRSRTVLIRHAGFAVGITVLAAFMLWAVVRLSGAARALAHRRLQRRLRTLENKAQQLIRAEQVWALFDGLLRTLSHLLIAVLIYFYLHTVLGLFPWTRAASLMLFNLVVDPLRSLWGSFVASIPDLMFLAVLFVVVRYIIRFTQLFFNAVEHGRIRLKDFDPDWARPTFKLLRFLIIALGVVVAYPYIPGSDSMAFKGVSLFLGVIFSLGSSSFIANTIAGLSMTYRGAFKQGDLVKIDDVIGAVDDVKLMTTRIRTAKNEIAVIPNSSILNTSLVNYSALARSHGLALHTVVSIGYDVPWREVEAMLLEAVKRTDGLKTEPKPFVLHSALGDFAAQYEVNAYCDDPLRMLSLYSVLHANIQDVFNEHGVQIMSPAYTQIIPASSTAELARETGVTRRETGDITPPK